MEVVVALDKPWTASTSKLGNRLMLVPALVSLAHAIRGVLNLLKLEFGGTMPHPQFLAVLTSSISHVVQ